MVQYVGEIITFQVASTNQMIRMRDLSPISIFVLAILLSTYAGIAAAQPNVTTIQNSPLLPSVCLTAITAEQQQSCENALYADVEIFADYYTNKLAEAFSFCVIDPVKERDAAFDFSANLSFLSKCLYDTEGFMLNRFCSGVELKSYMTLLVNDIQSSETGIPTVYIGDLNCNETHWSQGCEDGWSMQLQANVNAMIDLYQNTSLVPLRSDSTFAPCCDGFYCPRSLACMIPCPLGAQCPKANYTEGLCSPYNYQLTPAQNFSCGGANMWTDLSTSTGIFCPAGFYCPSTDDIRQCDSGHYCRQGSTMQSKCSQFISCDAQATTQHLQTYGLMLIVGLSTILLLIYNCSDQVMHIREKHKMKSREKAAQQVREHFNAVERWRFAVDAAKRLSRTFSRRPLKSGEEMQVLAPPGLPRSSDVRARAGTIDEERSYHENNYYPGPMGEWKNERYNTDQPLEEDLYEPVEVPPVNFSTTDGQGATTSKPRIPQTTSQILRYAYGQIEKEKKVQSRQMGWGDVISHTSQHEHERGERLRLEITFQDLSLSLKGTGKKILCNVTGKLMPGHVTAVMGPSGAGKTTFLNALAGKAYNSTISGLVLINGKPDPIRCYRKVIGFVPQDDIVHGNLTVEENLWFSARYRLPIDMPKPEKVLVVERIIDALGLGSIRNSRVGTVEKRGISGGQRKRVNIGLEMVMAPSLLILDEPTSGLDSTSSQLVLRALRREAFVGVNVGVVLHQPSYGLFKMFDDVMFLAKGGRTVYLGPVEEVENYFAAMNIVVPERINPPDHYMDVLEGVTKPEGDPHFDPKILPIKWMRYNNYNIPEDLQATVLEMDVPPEKMVLKNEVNRSNMFGKTKSLTEDLWEEVKAFFELHWDNFKGAFTRSEDLSHRRTPGFFRQFELIIFRLALQRFRDAMVQTQDYLILLLSGACLGFITPTKDSSLGSNNYTYVVIALSLLCMIAALRTFCNDKLHFWRESASSINRVAYFLAKDTVDHFNTVIKPVVFLSLFYYFNNPRSTFVENYIVTIALVYCVVGIAYIFAISLESGPAQLWSVFLPIIFTLLATNRNSSAIIKLLQYCTYTRWALEAYVIANAKRYSGVWLITRCVDLYGYGYDLRHWALCLAVLFVMGFLARCVALLCLMLRNRKRQQ